MLKVNYFRLTKGHQTAADGFFLDLKTKLLKILARKNIKIELPNTLHEKLNFDYAENLTAHNNMAQTIVEFLNTASKLITEFDGKSENLCTFIDSLQLVEAIKGQHEPMAVSLRETQEI